jgi:hypothetical protein
MSDSQRQFGCFSQARNDQAQVYWNNRWYTASILFRSRDGFAYDVAVLRTGPGPTFRPVNLSIKAAVKGKLLSVSVKYIMCENQFYLLVSFLQQNATISFV